MESLLHKIRLQFKEGLPLAIYSLPNSDHVTVYFQKDSKTHRCNGIIRSGFVFAPFQKSDSLLLPDEHSDIVSIPLSNWKALLASEVPSKKNQKITSLHSQQDEKTYISLVQKATEYIASARASKIVTSRKTSFQLSGFDLGSLLNSLFYEHEEAMRYLWYHPESGLWCAATPELLLRTNGNEFYTMALAGTQKYKENIRPKWTSKEINEQRWVTEAIADKLHKVASVVKVSKVKNHRAGSMVHLKTDFEGLFKKGKHHLDHIVQSLHPTPAVCGTPTLQALKFIQANENYDREYYTGYLGPVDLENNRASLFVNLRCMKISDHKACLFVGGGITFDSAAKEEWEETENKLQTMLKVLQPIA